MILSLRGTPDENTRKQISNEYALKYVESLPPKDKVPLKELIPGAPAEVLDLLDRMLDLNPDTRIDVNEALKHAFLQSLHDEDDEPVFKGKLDFSFETDTSLDLGKVQKLILKEIAFYNPAYFELAALGQ